MTDYSIRRFKRFTKDEIISAIKQYALEKNLEYISVEDFCEWYNVSRKTVQKYGVWPNLCKEAGLNPRYFRTNDRQILFDNLQKVWERLGHQPRVKDMRQPLSLISDSSYRKVFNKNWYEICLEFLSWKTGMSTEEIAKETQDTTIANSNNYKSKRVRGIPLGLRYDVLKRDGFRCVKCGRSPATELGVVLHVDHDTPRSKEGDNSLENLWTLCSDCNLGKSNKL